MDKLTSREYATVIVALDLIAAQMENPQLIHDVLTARDKIQGLWRTGGSIR